MKLLIFIFLIPFVSCRRLADEPFEPLEPTDEPTKEPIPEGLTFKPVGCFRDRFRVRAMPQLLKNFRGTIDWNNLSKTVQKCADEAMNRRQEYFGIQFWGECWGGEEADLTYDMYGENPKGCYDNMVGMAFHNFVYKFVLPE